MAQWQKYWFAFWDWLFPADEWPELKPDTATDDEKFARHYGSHEPLIYGFAYLWKQRDVVGFMVHGLVWSLIVAIGFVTVNAVLTNFGLNI